MTTANRYVIGVYSYKNCSPIHLDPYDAAGAKRALAWQGAGQDTKDHTTFHICTPHETERGTFVSIETGAHFPANRGGWTEQAWSDFLQRVWGEAAPTTLPRPSYFVMNENTLGYINPIQPDAFCILHGSVLKGGHNWKNGPVTVSPLDVLRPATLSDFDEYRVRPEGHIA